MPFSNDALVMSEGTPRFTQERGIFILAIPVGEGFVRYGFLPHDFLCAQKDAKRVSDAFFSQQQVERFGTS